MANPESRPEIAKAIPIPLTIIEPERPPAITLPDFAAMRRQLLDDAQNFQRDNKALIASGKIPEVNLTQQGKADSTSTRTLADGRKVSLTFDDHAHLSVVEITQKNGDTDVASVKGGRVEAEFVKSKGAEVSYTFDANNRISKETISSGGITESIDLNDGKVVHSENVNAKQGIVSEFTDQPDDHSYRIAQPGGHRLKFDYDDNARFQFGIDHQHGVGEETEKTWLISPDGRGGTKVVRGQEV